MYKARYTESLIMLLIFATILFVVTAVVPASADPQSVIKDLDQAYTQIAQKVSPSVVRVSSTKNVSVASDEGLEPFLRQFPFFGDQFPKQPRHPQSVETLMGSGFIVSSDGLIMTNYHVVKDMKEITVTLPGKRDYKAKLIGADPESDIALIKIDAKNLPAVTWGDSSKLRVGEIVVAIGNPFGLSGTVTNGIVSATGRTNMGIIGYEDFIQTDAPINPGNSGGPLVNIKGEVVGINTAIATQSGGYMGVGFTIPSDSAKLVMDELLKYGKVQHGLLGINIQDLTEPLAKSFGRTDLNGALVSQVVPDSPAAKAGIKTGDIILDYNDKPVSGASQLKNLVGQTRPGSTAKLTIWRDKKTADVSVAIAERTTKTAQAEVPAAKASNELGITVDKVPPQLTSELGLKQGVGLVIKNETPDGRGAAMGLRTGDVILEVDNRPITSLSEFDKDVMEAKQDGVIRFMIQRGAATIFLAETF
ncbi:DegQ family serine endoprotease [Desulfomonile tiedjei]|uniref:Periplasmic serine protease, Do/DeqQ family n=1 Tax=Desulfomonile tiedjei (strain ATCC 49306 / DSM 6799 / DCB-1) TaxID=706587 RepID=I4C502_DESTA|nr:DegQ family serine endoprotease [Desulfomonile tiedjei]AFM24643.1 periplasmic serine protease, Do/DeqQ family [Desulfomonile tiedjei DSM 6799]